jgi:hypothetical protein
VHESDTLFALNGPDPVDFVPGEESYLLIKPAKLKAKPYPYQVFQVVVQTPFVRQSDMALFDEEQGVVLMPPEAMAADLMAHLGLFPSKGQARKNGWPGAIPDGWSELRAGKNLVFVWKPTE